MKKDKKLGTKVHYATHVRHWINWNLEFHEDPFEFPIPPKKIMYWIQLKVNDKNSIKSLKQWTGALFWICQIKGCPPLYKHDMGYIRYKKGLHKLYQEGKDHRLPFELKHVSKYIKKLWNRKTEPHTITYSNLLRAALAAVYYCTMSRPGELAKSKDLEGDLRGVTMADYNEITDHQHNVPMIHLTIHLYKNQSSKRMKKQIFFASTRCNKPKKCHCKWVNPFDLIKLLLARREHMVNSLKKEISDPFSSEKTREKARKRLEGLEATPTNYLFVHPSGIPVATGFITKIAEEIAKRNKILDAHHFTADSLRIGGTTRAMLSGIDHTMILRYVGWTVSRLADCSIRYMRYSPHHFAMVPFNMIHPKTKFINTGQIYDPWSEAIDQKYYNKQ